MSSRYFTFREGLHFPNECSHIEVTEGGCFLHHRDSGDVKENTDLKVPALDTCLRYVSSGNWVEIDAEHKPIVGFDPRDQPASVGDHW